MRVVFSVAPAKTNVTKKARSLIARARPTNESSFSFSGLKLHAMFESLWKRNETHTDPLLYPVYPKKYYKVVFNTYFQYTYVFTKKNMKQEQNRYVDRFLTGWL